MAENNEDLIYKNNRELFYSFDPETGSFTKKVGYQYQANQVIIKQGWDVLDERINEVRQKVLAGELSPLAYHMEKHQMEIPMLSDYTGIRKRRVRKHLTPKGFAKMTGQDRARYAEVFEITHEQLSVTE